jgi:hypothetical protein
MYIANPSRQVHDFQYWVVGEKQSAPRSQSIRPGGQTRLSGDLSTPQIERIAAHHARYGMISVDEVGRAKGKVPLIYAVDRQIPVAIIQRQMALNQGHLVLQGKEIRQQAAVAEAVRMEEQLEEQGLPDALRALDITIQEENPGADSVDPLGEGILVTRNTEPDGKGGNGLRQRGRRAS